MRLDNFLWLDDRISVSLKEIEAIEKKLCFKLPKIYKDIILDHDGCTPKKSEFIYFDISFNENITSGIGSFIPIKNRDYSCICSLYKEPPEFFPKNLVAFAETGSGDLICFDYRSDPHTDNPPIVYWNHEADIGKDVSFVAKDFEEFLSLLHEPGEEES